MIRWNIIIKKIREELLITQTEFAELVGSSFVSVNRWENGHCIPTIRTRRKIKQLMKQYNIREE